MTNPDISALVEAMRSKGQPSDHLGNRLADAVEALAAERDHWKFLWKSASDRAFDWEHAWQDMEVERDALRAQLNTARPAQAG